MQLIDKITPLRKQLFVFDTDALLWNTMALYIKHPITCILSNVQLDEDIRNTKCYRFRYKKMQMSCDQNSAP